jgi:hypothetical protein
MPKLELPPRKIVQTTPKVGDVTFAFDRKSEEPERNRKDFWFTERNRKDFWFKGNVEINKVVIPYQLHLFSCDGSVKGSKGRYNCSIDLNEGSKQDLRIHGCPYCSGNEGVSSPTTKGLTAAALAPVLFPRVEHAGYSIFQHKHNPGGWYLFSMLCDTREREDVIDEGFYRTPRFYISWISEYTCPVHGKFLWKECEFGA